MRWPHASRRAEERYHRGRPAMSAVVDFPVKPETRPYLEAVAGSPGEPEWLMQHRRRALARFAELGFPSRHGEAWRYLDLRPLEQAPLRPLAATEVEAAPARGDPASAWPAAGLRLTLLDGRFAPELSRLGEMPATVWFGSMRDAIVRRPDLVGEALEALAADRDQPFAALNAGVFGDGFTLAVPEGVVVEPPIEILHLASGRSTASFHTRSLVTLGAAGRDLYRRRTILAQRCRRCAPCPRRCDRPGGAGRGSRRRPASRRIRCDARPRCASLQHRIAACRRHAASRRGRALPGRGRALRALRRLSRRRAPAGQFCNNARPLRTTRRNPRSV